MEKTKVSVEFSIIGDDFYPTMITEQLAIEPTESWMKGEKVKNRNIVRKETCWSVSTGDEESFDINNQLKKIVDLIKPQKNNLKRLQKLYKLEYMFMIVMKIENNETPAIYLESETISFMNDINAEIHFDVYNF